MSLTPKVTFAILSSNTFFWVNQDTTFVIANIIWSYKLKYSQVCNNFKHILPRNKQNKIKQTLGTSYHWGIIFGLFAYNDYTGWDAWAFGEMG